MSDVRIINGTPTRVEDTDRVFECPTCGEQALLLESEWHYHNEWSCESCGRRYPLSSNNMIGG